MPEPQLDQRLHEEVPAFEIVAGQLVVVVGFHGQSRDSRLLQRRRGTDRQEVVHLPDGPGEVPRCNGVADAPSGHAEGLGEGADGHGPLSHARKQGDGLVDVPVVQDVLVDLVGEDVEVVADRQLGDPVQLVAVEDLPDGLLGELRMRARSRPRWQASRMVCSSTSKSRAQSDSDSRET